MELRQLRYFVGVALEGNFTRAAKKLHVAQPALSRQIRQLEEELGVTLLTREARGVTLTSGGKAFLEKAVSLLEQSDAAVRSAKSDTAVTHPPLNLGYVWGIFHTLVPKWVADFRSSNPNVPVNLLDLSATGQIEALRSRSIDMGFIGFALEADSTGLEKQKVGQCEFMAVLPVNHPAARKKKVPLDALAQDFFIVISDQTYPGAAQVVTDACRKQGFKPRILQTGDRGYTILGLVAGNCGVTLLPKSLMDMPHQGVVFRPLETPLLEDIYVAWSKSHLPASGEVFLRYCKQADQENR